MHSVLFVFIAILVSPALADFRQIHCTVDGRFGGETIGFKMESAGSLDDGNALSKDLSRPDRNSRVLFNGQKARYASSPSSAPQAPFFHSFDYRTVGNQELTLILKFVSEFSNGNAATRSCYLPLHNCSNRQMSAKVIEEYYQGDSRYNQGPKTGNAICKCLE